MQGRGFENVQVKESDSWDLGKRETSKEELIKEVMNQVCLTIHAYAENFYNFKVQISLVLICLV